LIGSQLDWFGPSLGRHRTRSPKWSLAPKQDKQEEQIGARQHAKVEFLICRDETRTEHGDQNRDSADSNHDNEKPREPPRIPDPT